MICRYRAASSQDGRGGLLVTGGEMTHTTEVFFRGRWSKGPNLPVHRFDHGQVLLGDTVYVTGGFTSWHGHGHQASTLKLTKDGNWVEVGSLAVARNNFACAVHDGKIFVIGGGDGRYLSSVEIFDPASETWTFGPMFPKELTDARAFSWGGSLWVMGGKNNHDHNTTLYRLEENGWKDTGLTVEARAQIAQIVDNDIINC